MHNLQRIDFFVRCQNEALHSKAFCMEAFGSLRNTVRYLGAGYVITLQDTGVKLVPWSLHARYVSFVNRKIMNFGNFPHSKAPSLPRQVGLCVRDLFHQRYRYCWLIPLNHPSRDTRISTSRGNRSMDVNFIDPLSVSWQQLTYICIWRPRPRSPWQPTQPLAETTSDMWALMIEFYSFTAWHYIKAWINN